MYKWLVRIGKFMSSATGSVVGYVMCVVTVVVLFVLLILSLPTINARYDQAYQGFGSSIDTSLTRRNNNPDPYKGWVVKHRDGGVWEWTFFRCDANGTATYRTYKGGIAVVPESSDCKK